MYSEEQDRREALCDAVDDLVGTWPGVSRKTMFGCPSYVADGVLFAVVSEQGLSLTRLSTDERARLERVLSVEPFEAGGRLVQRWATVRVSPDGLDPVADALRQSYETAVV